MNELGRRRLRRRMAHRVDLRYHHSSHRRLFTIQHAKSAPSTAVDAVIVPAARPISWTREAMSLAHELRTVLVVMCSRMISADEVAELGENLRVSTVAVDLGVPGSGFPTFLTSECLAGTPFERSSDASQKRNLAILLARLVGWARVLFLDDDIYGIDPADARFACGLLDYYYAVGLQNIGFPDNSVVCHAHRAVGGRQAQFVGVGGLAVAPQGVLSFFPDIYNQDWFFLIGDARPLNVAMTGAMCQKEFDPFANPDRARSEEFGDCLAEGLYWLLDHHLPIETADNAHWRDFLDRRGRFIDHLLRRLSHHFDGDSLRKRQASLEIAKRTCEQIDPTLCTEYLVSWRADLGTWRRFMDAMPTGVGVDQAMDYLGLAGVVHQSGP